MDRDRDRLAEVARARRLELVRSMADVAKAGSMSHITVAKIEKGQKVRDLQLFKLDDGLEWSRGSAEAILRGGNPVLLEDIEEPPDWRPPALTADTVAQYMPAKGDKLTHPEDIEIWSLRSMPEDDRRELIGYRRALRAGERGVSQRTGN